MTSNALPITPELDVSDLDRSIAFYQTILGFQIRAQRPEERWYRQGEEEFGNRQFVLIDPDGYLLRFFTDLGRRPVNEV